MENPSNKIVSAVVVTAGAHDYAAACLDSLRTQTRVPSEIIVIDNSLQPDFSRRLARSCPPARIEAEACALSYCASLNKGIRQSRGEFVLCLNDDVVLGHDFIERALSGFSFDPSVGMVSGKLLRMDGRTLDSAGLSLSIWRTAKERGYGTPETGRFERPGYIFGANGAAAFLRRRMLDQIKDGRGDYFDEEFRFFYEDLDLAWRAQRHGWKGYYVPQAVARHVRGASVRAAGGVDRPCARRYLTDGLHADLIKNRYLTLIKNESLPGFLAHLPFIIVYDLVAWGYCAACRPRVVRSVRAFPGYFRSAFRKRKNGGRTGKAR